MTVEAVETSDHRRTRVWEVLDRHGGLLGYVQWYGAWRQYSFMPTSGAVFNRGCLADITAFIDEKMREWRKAH